MPEPGGRGRSQNVGANQDEVGVGMGVLMLARIPIAVPWCPQRNATRSFPMGHAHTFPLVSLTQLLSFSPLKNALVEMNALTIESFPRRFPKKQTFY